MNDREQSQAFSSRVVVVASSVEGIDALARLIDQISAEFPLPVVVYLHGMQKGSMSRLQPSKRPFASGLEVVHAQHGEFLRPGCVYVVTSEAGLIFVAINKLGFTTSITHSNTDHLFESAAEWYRSGVIGVVLSGLGTDGTKGLQAITKVDGIRIVQSPYDAIFPNMPTNALIGDDVQYAVMLDQLGTLLTDLALEPKPVEAITPEVQAEIARQLLDVGMTLTESLRRSIDGVLQVAREDLAMDITFITEPTDDEMTVSYASAGFNQCRMQGMSYPKHQSFCQRVLDGRLPAIMPDVEKLRLTHDVPVLPIAIGAYMATPILLRNGLFYGMLCCLTAAVSHLLDQRHYRRLEMSANQIARLIDAAEGA